MSEPLYEYIKGQGWVLSLKRPKRPRPSDYGLICNNCGVRYGKHRENENNDCPTELGYSTTAGWA